MYVTTNVHLYPDTVITPQVTGVNSYLALHLEDPKQRTEIVLFFENVEGVGRLIASLNDLVTASANATIDAVRATRDARLSAEDTDDGTSPQLLQYQREGR